MAAEMALLVPLLLVLMFGGLEGANYLWREHEVVKGVRDGARYASRLPFDAFTCGASAVNSPITYADQINSVTRTGVTDATTSTPVRVPGWTSARVTIAVTCDSTHNTGLYTDISTGAPVVRVAADVPYRPVFLSLGFVTSGLHLRASSQAAVMGI